MRAIISLAVFGLAAAAPQNLDVDNTRLGPDRGAKTEVHGYIFQGDQSLDSFPWHYVETQHPDLWNRTKSFYDKLDCKNQRAWQDSFIWQPGPEFWKPCDLNEAVNGPPKASEPVPWQDERFSKMDVMRGSARTRLDWVMDHYGSPLEVAHNNFVVPVIYYKMPKIFNDMLNRLYFNGKFDEENSRIGIRSRAGTIDAWNKLPLDVRHLALRHAEAIVAATEQPKNETKGYVETVAGLYAMKKAISRPAFPRDQGSLLTVGWAAAGGEKEDEDRGRYLLFNSIFQRAADRLLAKGSYSNSTSHHKRGEKPLVPGRKPLVPGKMLPNPGQGKLNPTIPDLEKDVETTGWDRLESRLRDLKKNVASKAPVPSWNPRDQLRHYPLGNDRSRVTKYFDQQDWDNYVNKLHDEQHHGLHEPGANPLEQPTPPEDPDSTPNRPNRNHNLDPEPVEPSDGKPSTGKPSTGDPSTGDNLTGSSDPSSELKPAVDSPSGSQPGPQPGSDPGSPPHSPEGPQPGSDPGSPPQSPEGSPPHSPEGSPPHSPIEPPASSHPDPSSPSIPDKFYEPGSDTEMNSGLRQIIEDGRELKELWQKTPSKWGSEDWKSYREIGNRFGRWVESKRAQEGASKPSTPVDDSAPVKGPGDAGNPPKIPEMEPVEPEVPTPFKEWGEPQWRSAEDLLQNAEDIRSEHFSSPAGSDKAGPLPDMPLSSEELSTLEDADSLAGGVTDSVLDLAQQILTEGRARIDQWRSKYDLPAEPWPSRAMKPNKGTTDEPGKLEEDNEPDPPDDGPQSEPEEHGKDNEPATPADEPQSEAGTPNAPDAEPPSDPPVKDPSIDSPVHEPPAENSRFPNGGPSEWPVYPDSLRDSIRGKPNIRPDFPNTNFDTWTEAEWDAFFDWTQEMEAKKRLPTIPESQLSESLDTEISADSLPGGFRAWLKRAWLKIKYASKNVWNFIRNVFPKKAIAPVSLPSDVKKLPQLVTDIDFSSTASTASTETLGETVERLFGKVREGSNLDGMASERSSNSWETLSDAESIADEAATHLSDEFMEVESIIDGVTDVGEASIGVTDTALMSSASRILPQELGSLNAARAALQGGEAGGEASVAALDSGLAVVEAVPEMAAATEGVVAGTSLIAEAASMALSLDGALAVLSIGLIPLISWGIDPRKTMEFKNKWLDVDGDGIREFVKHYYEKADPNNPVMQNFERDLEDAKNGKEAASALFSGSMRVLNVPAEPLTIHHKDENRFTYWDEKYGWIHQDWKGPYLPVMSKLPTAQGSLAETLLNWNDPSPDKVRRAWNWFMELIEKDRDLCTKGGDIEATIIGNFHPGEARTVNIKYHFGRPSGTYCWADLGAIIQRRATSGTRFDAELLITGDIDGDNRDEIYKMKSNPDADNHPGALTVWFDAIQDDGGFCDAQHKTKYPCSPEVFLGKGEKDHVILIGQGWRYDKQDWNITIEEKHLPQIKLDHPPLPNDYPASEDILRKGQGLWNELTRTLTQHNRDPLVVRWLTHNKANGGKTLTPPKWNRKH